MMASSRRVLRTLIPISCSGSNDREVEIDQARCPSQCLLLDFMYLVSLFYLLEEELSSTSVVNNYIMDNFVGNELSNHELWPEYKTNFA